MQVIAALSGCGKTTTVMTGDLFIGDIKSINPE